MVKAQGLNSIKFQAFLPQRNGSPKTQLLATQVDCAGPGFLQLKQLLAYSVVLALFILHHACNRGYTVIHYCFVNLYLELLIKAVPEMGAWP